MIENGRKREQGQHTVITLSVDARRWPPAILENAKKMAGFFQHGQTWPRVCGRGISNEFLEPPTSKNLANWQTQFLLRRNFHCCARLQR
jgi:hypothetical protein